MDAHRQEALRIDCACCMRLRARRWWWHEDDAAELRVDDADADDRDNERRRGLLAAKADSATSLGSAGSGGSGSNGGASPGVSAPLAAPLLDKGDKGYGDPLGDEDAPLDPRERSVQRTPRAAPPAVDDGGDLDTDMRIERQTSAQSVIPTRQIYAADEPAIPRVRSYRGPRQVGWRRYAWLYVNRGNYIKLCMRRYYAPCLMRNPVRALVVLLWAALLAVSGYGVTQLQMGLEQQLAVPVGSYVRGGRGGEVGALRKLGL